MTNSGVLRRTELRVLDEGEVDQMLKASGLKVPPKSSIEDKIELLVRSSWPVEPLPNSRPNSRRGRAIRAVVGESGKPNKGGTDILQEAREMSDEMEISEEEALAQLRLYLRDLQRYYGYDVSMGVMGNDGLIVHAFLTDGRRLKALKEAG